MEVSEKALKKERLLDLDLLRTFAVVAETGELKKAADVICRSQAAVSMQIKKLENLVGSSLMERSNRGIQLTDIGKTLLAYSEQFLQLNNLALSALNEDTIAGHFNFGVPTDYTQCFLTHFMPLLRKEIPNLETTITCDRSRELRKKVATGELDIAIVSGETQYENELTLWSERLFWVAANHHNLDQLASLPIAIYQDNCILRDLCEQGLQQAHFTYHEVLTSTLLENIATAVNTGYAIALLPDSLINTDLVSPLPSSLIESTQTLTMNMIHSPHLEDQTIEKVAQCFQLAGRKQNYR
ncbi:LysR family transcriptional regulator [Photobacterium minamisatsumaniensis]|uniref:LysR family transcriptional regulator n=1 Tax=Photobacterium minamisatsumaniensis TaxID=2910233 RepID=UPI003D147457